MNATLGKKLRFSDVVYAIGTTPKSLRLWFQRDLVQIHTPKPEGGAWTTYSFIDIAILALVRTFVNFGMGVPAASEVANAAMRDFFPQMLSVKDPDNMPAGAIALLWSNARLQLFQSGDEWQIRHVALWQSDLDPARDEGFDPHLPSGVARLRSELEPAPVFLSIDVETVLRTAFERANDSVTEGADE
jgi:hypothetical protein